MRQAGAGRGSHQQGPGVQFLFQELGKFRAEKARLLSELVGAGFMCALPDLFFVELERSLTSQPFKVG
jgi:hypothetical protein